MPKGPRGETRPADVIAFAIKICERPDAGVAEDEPGFSAALSPSAPQRSSSYVGGAKNRQAEAKKIVIAAITPSAKKRWSLFPGAGTRDDSDDISASKFLIFEVLHSVALSCGCCRSEKNLCPSGPECALLEQPFGRWWTRTKPLSAACAVAKPRRTPTSAELRVQLKFFDFMYGRVPLGPKCSPLCH